MPAAKRSAVAVAIVGALAASWLTAGPGNGFQPTRPVVHVTLPTVYIVGRREAAEEPSKSAPLSTDAAAAP